MGTSGITQVWAAYMKATVDGERAVRVSVEPVSGNSGESMQIRPKGYGLVPLSLLSIGYPLILLYAAWINTYSNHVALVAMFILAIGALATWVLTYHWRARIVVDSTDGTLERPYRHHRFAQGAK
jgi:hypothetical protein